MTTSTYLRTVALSPSRQRLLGLVLALVLTLPAIWPLLILPGLPSTPDGPHHLFRLFDFDLALRGGAWYPRWLPNLGFGYGFPTLNYYAPLTYYLGECLHLLGFGFIATLRLLSALGFLAAAAAMYGLANELAGPWAGVLAAAVYTYAPYHLVLTWLRGALPEHLALAWLPVLLWAAWRITQQADRRAVIWGGLGLAGLVLTHNLTALMTGLLVAALAIGLLLATDGRTYPRDRALQLFGMALLGLGSSAFFWLPALSEAGLIHASRVAAVAEEYTRYLYQPGQLLSLHVLQGYDLAADAPLTNPALGLWPTLLAVAGLTAGLMRWRRLDGGRRALLLLLAGWALLASVGLLTTWEPLWSRVPRIALLQYPARWQTTIGLSMALLSGFLLWRPAAASRTRPARRALPALAAALLGVVLAIAGMARLAPEPASVPTRPDEPLDESAVTLANLMLHDYSIGIFLQAYGGRWFFEYLPRTVTVPREELFKARSEPPAVDSSPSVSPATNAEIIEIGPTSLRLAVDSPTPWPLRWHQFYFPGWQVRVDGRPVPTGPAGDLGLVGAEIPAGQHQVEVRFGDTPVRRAGWAVTLLAMLALAGLLWRAERSGSPGRPAHSPAGMAQAADKVTVRKLLRALAGLRPSQTALLADRHKVGLAPSRRCHTLARTRRVRPSVIAGLAVIAGFIVLVLLARGRTPAVYTPIPLQANYNSEVRLLGYRINGQATPGAHVDVTLHWLALRPLPANYKVFLHLTDESGKAVAQHDGEPGFFFSPTTRWLPGEIISDVHGLDLPADLAPGQYVLRAGLYEPAGGAARLPVLDPAGQPVDNQMALGTLEVR